MARPLAATLLASSAQPARALPANPQIVTGGPVGDSASPTAMVRLTEAVATLKLLRTQALLPTLHQAINAMREDRALEGAELAVKALEIDEACALAWHILGICREKSDDFTSAIRCYETAFKLDPDEPEIANDLGRLAYRMDFKPLAEQFFREYLRLRPGSLEGVNNLANAQRDQMNFAQAVETLRPSIEANPGSALLWNTLGSVVAEQGDMAESMVFFDEALKLDPTFAKARYNRANVRLSMGDPSSALIDCEAALPGVVLQNEAAMMRLARATMLIASGRLDLGWEAYEVRLDDHYADVTHFMSEAPTWTPDMDLAGRHLLLIGEQGLGDEVMFANVVHDVIRAVGPHGRVTLAAEHRLVPLFARSFPQAEVRAHGTMRVDHHTVRGVKGLEDWNGIDAWAPLASVLRRFRTSEAAFPDTPAFLTPDPARVDHWRGVLDMLGPGLKVGVVWKSLFLNSNRSRYFSPFDLWSEVLQTPGATMVNLQYGESDDEIAQARAQFGVDVWTPPGIDLKNDLDDLAALTVALDVVVGPPNATTNIAAASGGEVWMLSSPGSWPRLGTDRYPWYPRARVFTMPAFNAWAPLMRDVAAALAERASS